MSKNAALLVRQIPCQKFPEAISCAKFDTRNGFGKLLTSPSMIWISIALDLAYNGHAKIELEQWINIAKNSKLTL